MKSLLKNYENLILILALLVFASVLIANNVNEKDSPNFLERASLTIASPLQKGVTSTIGSMVDTWNGYINLVNTSAENIELRKNLARANFKNDLLLEELKKYRRVSDLLSFHPVARGDFKVADVIGWDSTNHSKTFSINKGAADGIKEKMAVLTHEGLIGRVVASAAHSSRVLMITDSRSAVDAYVQNSRERCIVVGQNKKRCIVKYLSLDAKIEEGDMLISAGLGGIFPKGLPIGKIASISPDPGRLFYKAELIPSANFKQVEEVLVMTGIQPQDETKKD